MSAEQVGQPDECRHHSFVDYAEDTWLAELVRMQNSDSWSDQPILLNGLFQELYAKSLIEKLREKDYFKRFGGKTLEILMIQTDEPYMYNIALHIENK